MEVVILNLLDPVCALVNMVKIVLVTLLAPTISIAVRRQMTQQARFGLVGMTESPAVTGMYTQSRLFKTLDRHFIVWLRWLASRSVRKPRAIVLSYTWKVFVLSFLHSPRRFRCLICTKISSKYFLLQSSHFYTIRISIINAV